MGQDICFTRTIMKMCLGVFVVGLAMPAQAQVTYEANAAISAARTRAALIHSRLTGQKVPIDSKILKDMEALIAAGDSLGAARLATDAPSFYSHSLRLHGAKLSTREGVYRIPMNDLTATIIGFAKDDRDMRDLLTSNGLYRFQNINGLPNSAVNILRENSHYTFVDAQLATNPNLDLRPLLVDARQQILDDNNGAVNHPDAAGILTSRQFLSDCANAGTNRRCYEKTVRRLTCHDMTEVISTSLPDDRVGRDVSRAPGGDASSFLLTCKGCHSNMDGQRSAFAYTEFDNNSVKHGQVNGGGLFNGTTRVSVKMNRGGEGNFTAAYTIENDNWVNYAIGGEFGDLYGWRDADGKRIGSPVMSRGLNAYGTMISRSEAFSRCMVQVAFENVCRRAPTSAEKAPGGTVASLARAWEQLGSYKVRSLYERVVTSPACLGQ